jgi:uncharacterized repeat protein (TIGR01451 family)
MKSLTEHIKRVSLVMVALSSVVAIPSAFAATGETTAGTDISNTATVNYTVGSASQAPVSSLPATFKVDKRIDFTVASGSGKSTSPGATGVGLPFTVSNTGNTDENFTLAAANDLLATDNFDIVTSAVYLDIGIIGTYEPGIDTLISSPQPITRDTTINVLIVSTIPVYSNPPTNTISIVNGNTSVMKLTATATSAATVGAETPGTVDVVYADTGRDGIQAASNTYTIGTAQISVQKTSTVISDPLNNTTNPKAIPQAIVEYTITVTNGSATVPATAVRVVDTLPTQTTYEVGTLTLDGAPIPDAGNTVGSPVTGINTAANTFTVTNAAPKVVKFRVKIK